VVEGPVTGAGVTLYVGADAQNVQRRRFNLTGLRCFSGAYGPMSRFTPDEAAGVVALLDSGAFSDPPGRRLTPEGAMGRQLRWETNAERWWGYPWRAEALVSYDLLVDEHWCDGRRKKHRWTVAEADRAVRVTVDAAAYLASQRGRLAPRRLVLAAQGVDACQYQDCAAGVLAHATPGDTLGLGGWCILGRWRSWLPTFWAAMRRTLPRAAAAGLTSVHLFGVLYRPALGPLLWLCDRHGLALSTDSKSPALDVTWKDAKKAGARAPTWEANVAWWRDALAGLRDTGYYREPPSPHGARQLFLFGDTP
jgi:hypothetical protein